MILLQVLAEQEPLLGALDQFQSNGPVRIQCSGEENGRGERFNCQFGCRDTGVSGLWGGQPGQPSTAVEFAQKKITLAALESTVGATPLQQFAKGRRQFGQSQTGEFARDASNQVQFGLT